MNGANVSPAKTPPPPPPNRPDSVLAVGAVPPEVQRRWLRTRVRTSAVWLISVPGAVIGLMLAGFELCATPQERFETAGAFLIVLVLCLGWMLLMKLLYGRRPAPALWNEVRINELHPLGAVSRGANGTIVLPFEEVFRFEESANELTLFGKGGVISWSADDLTLPAAAAIQTYLCSRVPPAAIRIKEPVQARAAELRPLPSLPKRGGCYATAAAESRPRKTAALRFGRALARSAPLMWLFAVSAGVLLHEMIDFDVPVFDSPWVWFVGLSAIQAALLFGLFWMDAAARKKQPYTTPGFSFCEDGLWMTAGRGEVRFPRGSVSAIRLRKALELRLPGGSVRLPYAAMSDPEIIFRYFDRTT